MLDKLQVAYTIFCILVVWLGYTHKSGQKRLEYLINRFTETYETIKEPMSFVEEEKYAIKNMYAYPISSVKPIGEVDYIDLGPYGIKYDREIMLFDPACEKMLTNMDHFPINSLRQ